LNKLIVHIAYFFLPLFPVAQTNLIINGDLEQYSSCPTSNSNPFQFPKEIEKCAGWKAPTYGTSDYFHECAVGTTVEVPINAVGSQSAFSGKGYLGGFMASYTGGAGDDGYSGIMWWEYVQGTLIQTLEAGKIYKFSMEISLAEYSDLMINEIGVYFSDIPISSLNTASLTVSPQIVFSEPNYFRDTTNWIHLETYYVANGTENYLTVGNFKNEYDTDSLRRYNNSPFLNPNVSFYYFDNFSLTGAESDVSIPNVFTPNGDGANDFWKLPFSGGNTEKQVFIVNRWGNLIAQGSLNGFSWDGKDANGSAVSDGVYFYKVSDTNISGFIQLIR
jgi:gliding motility-associated-like protein